MIWNINNLYLSTLQLNPARKKPSDSPVRKIVKIIPFAGVKSCLFQFSMRAVTDRTASGIKPNHRINLLFSGLDVVVSQNPIKKIGYFEVKDKGLYYYIPKISTKLNPIRYRCTCSDSYFTWLYADWKNNVIFGDKPRPYKRKTPLPPKGYPYRNPKLIPGACKHYIHSISLMQQSNFLK